MPKERGVGVRVKLTGINSKPEYNNTMATIVEWDTKNERWKAQCDYDGSRKALKDDNMIIVGWADGYPKAGGATPAPAASPAVAASPAAPAAGSN